MSPIRGCRIAITDAESVFCDTIGKCVSRKERQLVCSVFNLGHIVSFVLAVRYLLAIGSIPLTD